MTKLSRFAKGGEAVQSSLKLLRLRSMFPVTSELLHRPHTRAASMGCAFLLARPLHLHSACAWSKSARKPFVIKIKKQPAPSAEGASSVALSPPEAMPQESMHFKNACHW